MILKPGASFDDIPQIPRAHYRINVFWDSMERYFEDQREHGLDLDPEYQRGHVWSPEQQRKYVEYRLQGGEMAKQLTAVSIGWNNYPHAHYSLMDGKQRIEAVRAFLGNKLPVFGLYANEFSGRMRSMLCDFEWCVIEVKSITDVYRTYLTFNDGGTVHSEQELHRVRGMIQAEEAAKETTAAGLHSYDGPVPRNILETMPKATITVYDPPKKSRGRKERKA